MSQPKWKELYSTDYSRLLIDETGVYPPELEISQEDEDAKRFYVYRVCLDPVTIVDGKATGEWFCDDLASVASTYGTTVAELTAALGSDVPGERAWAYECIGGHFGFDNFDGYPLCLTEREFNMRWHGHFVDVDAEDPEIEIELTAEPEDIAIEGNALVSGDDAEDAAENARIRSELEGGNEWAWCTAHVRVTYKRGERGEVSADAYLGACSYKDKRDFERDNYYDDLVSECIDAINVKLRDTGPA